jgi:hypothetical protein
VTDPIGSAVVLIAAVLLPVSTTLSRSGLASMRGICDN